MEILNKKIISKNELFKYTKRVSIELSNQCNYSKIHKECPLSLENAPKILSTDIIYSIFNSLHLFKFDGIIAFHTYNEPTVDKRLIELIEKARNFCPDSDIYLSTNGSLLTQKYINKLVNAGLTSLHVSAYFDKDFNNASNLRINIKHKIVKTKLISDHLEIYDKPLIDCKKPCFAPLNEIIITCDGNLSLCCREWKRKYIFGNLKNMSLEDILRDGELHAIYNELSNGNRFFDICKRCASSR